MNLMNKINKKIIPLVLPICLILVLSFSRLIPHPWNFTPILATGIFAGFYFKQFFLSLFIVICSMFLGDLFLGFHSTMWAVYGSFILVVILGTLIKKVNFINIFSATIASSLLFFIITNFAVWTQGSFYPMSFSGLVECYTMGIPFFKNTIIGDLLFSGVIFGGFTIAQTKFSVLKEITITVENK